MKIKITPTQNNKASFIMPTRAYDNDAGLDVYALSDINVLPNSSISIDLGFKVEIPDGYVGFICPRSSFCRKRLNTILAPIDSRYRGPLHLLLENNNSEYFHINYGDKIGQLVVIPVAITEPVLEFDNLREDKWNGSSDNGNIS